jgi:hypothetical protein
MLALLFGVALAGGMFQEPAGQPPVFRTEAYVVPLTVTVSRRTWYGRSKPMTDLEAADLEIILDDTTYVPIRLDADPQKPGRYLLSFVPPDHLRDGKTRQIEVRIKKRYSMKVTLTLPPAPAAPRLLARRPGAERIDKLFSGNAALT